ncbi:ribonuclease H-like domain-containing protein [Blakeslea trispora]|nr:ribonuclease H-like domain-containing protein [Blakeslea trispora]
MPPETTKNRPQSALEAARKRAAQAPNTSLPTKPTGPPTILPNLRSVIPLKVRQLIATKLYEAFQRIYEPILKKRPTIATEHAKEQEEQILSNTMNLAGYKQMATTILMHLKKRPLCTGESDVGLDGEWIDPREQMKAAKLIWDRAKECVLSESQLRELEYPMPGLLEEPSSSPTETVGQIHLCDRCNNEYLIKAVLSKEDMDACIYHPARIRMIIRDGLKQKAYGCCEDPLGSRGCARGPHVYKDTDLSVLHQKIPFVKPPASSDQHRKLIALDCEMGYTTAGMELIRLTAVDESMKVLLDELVLPSSMVVDLNTHYSGVKTLAGVQHDLNSVRKELFKYLSQDTILIGHGLENDLNALRIIHLNIVDTVALYPHKNGLPYRNKLSYLTSTHLKKFIQTGGEGHDSLEDATVCIELLKHYIKHELDKKTKK